MQSVVNLPEANITVIYCADSEHGPECPGEVEHVVPPGSMFTYDDDATNGADITSQLTTATEVIT